MLKILEKITIRKKLIRFGDDNISKCKFLNGTKEHDVLSCCFNCPFEYC